jgi:hypothetical protein
VRNVDSSGHIKFLKLWGKRFLQHTGSWERTKKEEFHLSACYSIRSCAVHGQAKRKTKTNAFFLGMLDIGKKTVDCALKRKTNGVFEGSDTRGRKPSVNKTPDVDINLIREHISSFPTVSSHYTRKDTKHKYLDAGLAIKQCTICMCWSVRRRAGNHAQSMCTEKYFAMNSTCPFISPKRISVPFVQYMRTDKREGNSPMRMKASMSTIRIVKSNQERKRERTNSVQ